MTYKTPIDRIIEEFNKLFEDPSFKLARLSVILSKLDLRILDNNNYRFTFNYSSIIKLYIFKKLKRIRVYNKLLDYLNANSIEGTELGFFKDEHDKLILPNKRTFNHYIKSRFNDDIKELIRVIEQKLSFIHLNPIQILDKQERRQKLDPVNYSEDIIKLTKQILYDEINLPIAKNAYISTKNKLLDILLFYLSLREYCNNGAKRYKRSHRDVKVPMGDTVLHHFHKLNDVEEIRQISRNIFDKIFKFSKYNYRLLRRRQLDVAFDIHPICYYGNKSDDYVSGGKFENGTSYFFKFLTCSIVVGGFRFILSAVPLHPADEISDLLHEMIVEVKSKINIKFAYLDRGFNTVDIINLLNKSKIRFIMPMTKTPRIKRWYAKSVGCKARVIEDFQMGDKYNNCKCNLILVEDKDGVLRSFITNTHIPVQLTHYLYRFYGKRWGIETTYRNLDHNFKAKTTSKRFPLRMFYFIVSVSMYNLWVLTNICLGLVLFGRVKDKPILTASLFCDIINDIKQEIIDPGG